MFDKLKSVVVSATLVTTTIFTIFSPTGCYSEPSYSCEPDPTLLELGRERVEHASTPRQITHDDGVLEVTLTFDSIELPLEEQGVRALFDLPVADAQARPPCSGHGVFLVEGRLDVAWTPADGETMVIAEQVAVSGQYTQLDEDRGRLSLYDNSRHWIMSQSCYANRCALDLEARTIANDFIEPDATERWLEIDADRVLQLDLSKR